MRRLLILVVCCSVMMHTLAQEREFINHLRTYQLDEAAAIIPQLDDAQQAVASWQVAFLKSFNTNNAYFNSALDHAMPNDGGLGDFYYHINRGDYYFYNFLDQNIKAMEAYKQALRIARAKENIPLICESLKKILTLHRIFYLYNNETYAPFLAEYEELAYDAYEIAHYHYFNLILNFKNYDISQWSTASKEYLDGYFKRNDSPYLKGITYTVYASYFEEIQQPDSLWRYATAGVTALEGIRYDYKGSRLNQLYSFMSRIALQQANYTAAAAYTKKAIATKYNSTDAIIRSRGHYQQAIIDSSQGKYLDAMRQTLDYRATMAKIEAAASNDLFNELEVRYQTAEKEKQLLVTEEEKNRNRNIAIALGGTAFFLALVGFLVYKNTKRKQHIAEQQRELEIQKKEKLLKNQELTAIDAMITGQEKERQRLASDLHDSVGATLAAAKLQFHHLSKNRDKNDSSITELFQKTGKLLDEAYEEVRSMAHVKNNGVIAKKSLLPAIQNLANSASGANGLTIEVAHFGLDKRLDNAMEIALFRIIQELVTNIIKHAQATEASIAINQYDDTINLIIEDNGKGFDARKLPEKDGMGLSSIERRIEHLEGTMEIDSTLGKGTHILIDIPL